MERLELVAFLENQIRLLEKAFKETDSMLTGVDRHEEWDYIGENPFWALTGISEENHRAKWPLEWSEEVGSAKVLDPIKNEIDSMKELIKTLKGEK